uniref:Secreted protein n=1 Tax=Achlya hypogyna TaxID=1202772 RepID=A0A0A7CP93_ACHHY|nr:secreted protein [Achlya hypogyna]
MVALTSLFTFIWGLFPTLCPWPHTFQYNGRDCREFELVNETHPETIAQHIIVGNSSNLPLDEFGELFGGIWYLFNNTHASTKCTSFAGTRKVGNGTYELTTYNAQTTSFSDSGTFYSLLRHLGVSYTITKRREGVYNIRPHMSLPPIAFSLELDVPTVIADWNFVQTNDSDVWIRDSTVFSTPATPYQMIRIVRADGSRTPYFNDKYLPDMRNHPNQLIPHTKSVHRIDL